MPEVISLTVNEDEGNMDYIDWFRKEASGSVVEVQGAAAAADAAAAAAAAAATEESSASKE